MRALGHLLRVVGALTFALWLSAPAVAQRLDPVGQWRIAGFGMPVNLFVEPAAEGETYPAYAVFLAPPSGTDCVDNTVLRFALCGDVSRLGPQVIRSEFVFESGGLFGAPTVYVATFEYASAFASVRLSIAPGSARNSLIWLDRTNGSQIAYTEIAVRDSDKPSPSASWAEGNWVADLGALRLEASFSPAGPGQLTGSVSVFDTGSRDFSRVPGNVAANWHRVAGEFYPFIMTGSAALGGTGAFYGGQIVTPSEYDEIIQDGVMRLLPLAAGVIVAEFSYVGNAGPLDQPFDAAPVVFVPLDGARSPVPPPPAPSTGLSGDPGTAVSGDEQAGDDGSAQPTQVLAQSLAGRWESGPSALIVGEAVSTPTPLTYLITVPHDQTKLLIEIDGYPDDRALVVQNLESALRYAEVLGPLTLNGQSVSQWLGGPPALGFSSYEHTPPHMLLARGDRGVLIMATPQADPVNHIAAFGSIPGGRIAFVTRVSGGPTAPPTQEGGPQLIDPPPPPPQLIEPLEDPRSGDSEIVVTVLDGAAGLVWNANLSAPCVALAKIENGLWAGAADGSVTLNELRALTRIIYAAGVNADTADDRECLNIIVMLQAEMDQRTPQ